MSCHADKLLSLAPGTKRFPVPTLPILQPLSPGDGHFSPIGGFHAAKDLVLILDTARFKYPPHWISLTELYKAMATLDVATGKARGFIKVAANPRLDSVKFTLNRSNRCVLAGGR